VIYFPVWCLLYISFLCFRASFSVAIFAAEGRKNKLRKSVEAFTLIKTLI